MPRRDGRQGPRVERNNGPEPEVESEAEFAPPPPARRIGELFLRQNAPKFNGAGEPTEAEDWVRSLEKIFEFLECTDKEKLICMPHQLIGEADRWWEELRKTMTDEQY